MDEVVIFMEVAVIAVVVIFWIFLFATKITISEGNAGRGKCNGFRCWMCRCIRRQRSDLEEGTYYMRKSNENTEDKRKHALMRCADLKKRLDAESQEKNDLSMRFADLKNRLDAESQEKNDLSVRFADLKKRLDAESQEKNDLSVRCADLKSRLEVELQEKNDLSMRLSAIIASRIKDGNTTIVDLTDENRPTKLAEYFSELYDNEWTDCFDELDNQKLGESESIRILLKILTDVFNACLEWSTEDYFMLVQRAVDRTYILEHVLIVRNLFKQSQADTHTDERLGSTETDKESENKGKGDAPSTTGDGPYDKQHESNAETTVYLDNPETTEAGQNGLGEEQSSTHYGSCFKQASQERDHSEAPSHDNMEKGSSLDGQDRSRKADNGKITNSEKEEAELPKDLLQALKEIKKRRALKVLPTIHEFIRRKIPALLQGQFASTHFQTYIQKCTEFSWLAVVQDPPLVLLADGGTKFDRKLFKEYMRRGPFVEFVVWPALLVEKGGAILSKGVAQGTNTAR